MSNIIVENKASNSRSPLLKAKREFSRKVYQIDSSERNWVKRNLILDQAETCDLARKTRNIKIRLSQMLNERELLKEKQLVNQKQLTLIFKEKKRLEKMKLKTNLQTNRTESRPSIIDVIEMNKMYKHFDQT